MLTEEREEKRLSARATRPKTTPRALSLSEPQLYSDTLVSCVSYLRLILSQPVKQSECTLDAWPFSTSSPDMPRDILTWLPFEIALHVLARGILQPGDLARAACVCRSWRNLCLDESVWKAAALAYGLTDRLEEELAVAKSRFVDADRYYAAADSWRELCVRNALLEEQIGASQGAPCHFLRSATTFTLQMPAMRACSA